jgi:hypothetical protein
VLSAYDDTSLSSTTTDLLFTCGVDTRVGRAAIQTSRGHKHVIVANDDDLGWRQTSYAFLLPSVTYSPPNQYFSRLFTYWSTLVHYVGIV